MFVSTPWTIPPPRSITSSRLSSSSGPTVGCCFGAVVSLFKLGQPAVDVLGADVERPQLDVGVFHVADPSQRNRVVGVTVQRHHELIAFGSQVSGTGQLFRGNQEPGDLPAIKLVEFGSAVVVEGFKI